MRRAALLLAGVAWALAVAAVVLHFYVEPPSRRINIRWSDAASETDVARLQQDLRLSAGELQGPTWSYALMDDSRDNIVRIVTHPLIADTHHIDRRTFTIGSDAPAWIRPLAARATVRAVADYLLPLGLMFGLVGLVFVRGVRPDAMLLILSVSLLLRMFLVFSGGQYYWPDEEGRYDNARAIVEALTSGQFGDAFRRLDDADPLFRIIATVPAAIEFAAGQDARIPAMFFAVWSALNIWLLGRIARRLGASQVEALLAAGLLALSSSFLYYARHLMPYDVAMTFGLLAIHAGTKPSASARSSLLCGVYAGCAFLTYAGYWTLAAAAVLVHAVDSESRHDFVRRGVIGGLGLGATLFTMVGINTALGGQVIAKFSEYSQTVTQGSFDEGWRLPWEYLWHAEHLLLAIWVIAVCWCVARLPVEVMRRPVRAGLTGVVFTYCTLAAGSVLLEWFVVYGRLARQLVPFLCLLTAVVLERMRTSTSHPVRMLMRAVVLLLMVQGAVHFVVPLRQSFPSEFLRAARRDGQDVTGAIPVYTDHIYPRPRPFTWPKRYSLLREARHPLQFLPYQYEGYTPSQRDALRSTDITMRLIVPLPD